MLEGFIACTPHAFQIGSEHGKIPHWDDIVVENDDGVFEHIQVKQENVDFSNDKITRGLKTKGNTRELKELSELDEAIKSLNIWLSANTNEISRRKFRFVCPAGSIKIKSGLELHHFERFCNKDITDQSNIHGLEQLLSVQHGPTEKIQTWLQSWCDVQTNEQILTIGKKLDIQFLGNEENIEILTRDILQRYFHSVNEVCGMIDFHTDKASSYTSAVTPRYMLEQIRQYLHPQINRWTQYYFDKPNWHISGTVGLSNGKVDTPCQTVPAFWNTKSRSILRLNSGQHSSPLTKAIIRLAFHIQNVPIAHFRDHDTWITYASKFVGETLGTELDDCAIGSVNVIADPEKEKIPSETRPLMRYDEHDEEAKTLNEEMNQYSWNMIASLVTDKIGAMKKSQLRSGLEERWLRWQEELNKSADNRMELLRYMLTARAEGDIEVEIRLGPKTAKLLAEGIYLILIVSVGLSDIDLGWNRLNEDLTIGACAITHWAGPAGNRKVVKIEEEGVDRLLGQESRNIYILSGVQSSSTEIIQETMADSIRQDTSLASQHTPTLLVTNSLKLRRLIDKGDLHELRSYLGGELKISMHPYTV